jgi:hypothetical protein
LLLSLILITAEAQAEAKTNKAHSDKLNSAADNLEKNLSQCVVAAKGVLQKPNDTAAQDTLASSVADVNASLAAIAVATSPTTPLSDIEATAAEQAAAVLALSAAPNDEQLKKVKDNQAKLHELIERESANPQVPKEASASLAKDVADLDKTITNIEAALKEGNKPAASSACLAAQTPLTRIADTAQSTKLLSSPEDTPEVVSSAKEKAQVLLSAIKAAKGGKVDPKSVKTILTSSQYLARSLTDLVGTAKTQAYLARGTGTLSETAENALALDELLSNLAIVGAPAATIVQATAVNASMDSLISSIGNEQLATVAPPTLKESPLPPPERKPKRKLEPVTAVHKPTLDESLKQVASEIRAAPVTKTATGAPSVASAASHSLATELERLASAAQHNKRQDVLVCGRSIAVLVTQIYETMRQTAKDSTNPLVQDKLFKSSQALKNFAIQLKILASVKAASSVDDNDADEQLGTLTRALGNALGEGLKAIDIHHKTSKKPVK